MMPPTSPPARRSAPLPVPGVAAHHPVTASIGAQVLRDGGNATDAAVTAMFAACVGETVLTGLAGAGFAMHWDAATRRADALDFFVDIPTGTAHGEPIVYDIDFGSQTVPYTVGPRSVGVPGNVPGLAALWERFGSRPWSEVLAPATQLARTGIAMTTEHADVLAMLADVLTLSDGARIYAPGGRLLRCGDRLHQPGLARAFEIVRDEGGAAFTTGTLARATVDLIGATGPMTARDLAAYTPRWSTPPRLHRPEIRAASGGASTGGAPERAGDAHPDGHELFVRDDVARLRELVAAMDEAHPRDQAARAVALARGLRGRAATGTTNVTAVDAAGNACVITSSLGLGSGDFLPGLDLQLNSMLGETDLMIGDRGPGTRLASNMVPLVVVDADGLVLAGGGAGGSRIPSAVVQVLTRVLDDGVAPQESVDAPRWHPLDGLVHHEPGVPEDVLAALASAGWRPNPWGRPHYYFGGVNLIGRLGGGGDARRDGVFVPA